MKIDEFCGNNNRLLVLNYQTKEKGQGNQLWEKTSDQQTKENDLTKNNVI